MESLEEEGRHNNTVKNSVLSLKRKQEGALVLGQEVFVEEEEEGEEEEGEEAEEGEEGEEEEEDEEEGQGGEGDDVADFFGCISLHKKSSLSVHGGNQSLPPPPPLLCVCVCVICYDCFLFKWVLHWH